MKVKATLGTTAMVVAIGSLWGQAQAALAFDTERQDTLLAQATTAPAWREGATYAVGAVVSYGGREYVAIVAHTAWAGTNWNPAATPTLWRALSGTAPAPAPTPSPSPAPSPSPSPAPSPSPGGTCYLAWSASTAYTGGATVSYNGVNYRANWWTQGNNPATSSGPTGSGQPWTVVGSCTGSPAPSPQPFAFSLAQSFSIPLPGPCAIRPADGL